ncbi:MAG: insulinase family protein [Bradyrhizobiaceae bacterium]|nr:insulinase family protein [Bradyrhizobiaceae bacterium]
MSNRIVVALLALFTLPALLGAQHAITDDGKILFNPAVEKKFTKNGIPFYFLHNSKPANRIDLILTVNAGSVLEDKDQYGLAHFCEHMAFNGTKSFPKQQLVNFLESTGIRFGADLNAYTNSDETVYQLTVPSDDAQTIINAVKVLRDWAAYVSYTDEDINEERGVVMEEWRLHRGAQDRISDIHRPVLFNNSAYATHETIGDTTTLLHCPPDALRRFYHKWYAPENMAIIVVGDVEYAAVHDIVMKYFNFNNESSNMATKRPTITIPDNPELQVSIASDPELQTAEFEYIIRRPADTTRTYGEYRASIARQLAMSMLNSRFAELTQKANPAFASARVGTMRIAREHVGLYLSTVASGKNVMSSTNAMMTEVERAKQHGFLDTELKRAKDQLLAQMESYYNERNKTESMGLAMELMRHQLFAESVPGIEHEVEIYRHYVPQISADECKTAFNALFTKKNGVAMVSVPEVDGYIKPTQQHVKDLLSAITSKTLEPYEEQVPVGPLMATEPKAGTITNSKADSDLGVKTLTLSNGAKVILKKTDYKDDEILFRAEAFGGQSLGSASDNPTLQNAAEIIDASGISTFDAPTLTKMLAGKNLSLSPYISMEQQGLSGSTSPKDLKTFFELVYLYFTEPRIDAQAISSWKTRVRTMLENKANNPQAALFDTVSTVLAQHHERSKPFTMADLDRIDPEKALQFYKMLFSDASTYTFTIVGNFDEAEIENLVKTYVASLPSTKSKRTWKDVGIRTATGKIDKTVQKGTDPKSFVIMAFSGPMTYDAEHRYELSALAEVMNIRLREKLREQASGVYFVSTQPQPDNRPVPHFTLAIVFTCNPERVDELTNMALAEIDTLAMKPVDQSYIDKVREIQLKEREVATKTNEFWLRGLASLALEGEPYSLIKKREELIKGLTADTVLKAAKTYLTTGNYARFALKPEQK